MERDIYDILLREMDTPNEHFPEELFGIFDDVIDTMDEMKSQNQ